MNRSSISPEILQPYLDSATNAADKGQAQWYTPQAWGRLLARPLPQFRGTIVDLTCGRGDLLVAARNGTTEETLGADIDPIDKRLLIASPNFINTDLTLLLPLLREVEFKADLFVLNPPWDLHWHRARLASLAESRIPAVAKAFAATDPRLGAGAVHRTIDSTVATLMLALDLCSDMGEGYIIANAATVTRLILEDGAPHFVLRDHVWAVLTVDGNICSRQTKLKSLLPSLPSVSASFRTAILYFAQGHTAGPRIFLHAANLEAAEDLMSRFVRHHRDGPEVRDYMFTKDTPILWSAVREESTRHPSVTHHSPFNIWLSQTGVIRTFLSLFQQHSVKVDKAAAAALHDINGKRPMQLVLQRAQRDALMECISERSPWKVSPDLAAAVAQAIQDYHAQRAPLYPLPEIQRLGYLDEEDEIVCRTNLLRAPRKTPLFGAGTLYKIRTHTVTIRRTGERPNLSGELEKIEYVSQELCILITDKSGREWSFMENRLRDDNIWIKDLTRASREEPDSSKQDGVPAIDCIDFTLQELIQHFIIPNVPDVAAVNPEAYRRNLEILEEIESLCQNNP
ncbi:MAG: Methylase [Verrucomicrobiota bacterium]